jgi:HK97 family phage portal protein
MSVFDKIAGAFGFGKGDARPKNAIDSTGMYSDEVMQAFGITSYAAGQLVTPLSAMRVAAVFACVQRISGAIMTLPVDLYRTDGEIPVKQARDDLYYKLNEQPHPNFTAASHWENVSVGQLLRGDSFTWIRRGSNNAIRELLPLPAGSVSPMRQIDGSVRYYISLADYGIQTWVEPSEILHFPGFGFDGVKSMSVIQYAARAAVGNSLAMDEYSGKFFENGAHPSMILQSPDKMSDDRIAALQTAFATKYAGSDNYHRIPLVLTQGLTAKEISIPSKDAQLLEARQFQVVDIARAFGVPPHMIGETSASTSWGSGIESMSRGFVTYTLQPHLRKIEQELNRKLFPRDSGKFLRFDREALIEGDLKAQADYNRAALGGPGTGMGWMTPDEIRRKSGNKPLGGAAGELFNPTQPVADTSQQDTAVADLVNQLREVRHKNEIESASIKAKLDATPTIINVAAPVVNVPEQPPTVVNVGETVVNLPEQAPPVVNVTVEKQDAPIVNVTVPETNIIVEAVMPEQAAPVVYNNNVVNADSMKMEIVSMPDRVTTSVVERDAAGNITKAQNLERDA